MTTILTQHSLTMWTFAYMVLRMNRDSRDEMKNCGRVNRITDRTECELNSMSNNFRDNTQFFLNYRLEVLEEEIVCGQWCRSDTHVTQCPAEYHSVAGLFSAILLYCRCGNCCLLTDNLSGWLSPELSRPVMLCDRTTDRQWLP